MSILITGAAGFIGSAVAKKLIAKGYSCITIDNLSTGKKENIPLECRFIEGDVAEEEIIRVVFEEEKIEAIIHIAGQSSGEVSYDNPVYDLKSNTESTLLLLKYARINNCKKFIYASSMCVYGDVKNEPVDEEVSVNPKSFYAVGKVASEHYMRLYSQYGIACTALRFFNIYGIGQNMENLRQGMASIYLAQALNNKHVLVKGSKDRYRDFVYIDDLVDAVIKTLDRESGYEVYNVCTNVPTTVGGILKIIQEELPYDVTVEYSTGTPGDQFGIYGANDKIKNALGWAPKIDFKTGMKKMIEWAQKQGY